MKLFFFLLLLTTILTAAIANTNHVQHYNPKILIVDDNPDDILVKRGLLVREKITSLTSAESVGEAFNYLIEAFESLDPFVLIISDLRMPVTDGIGFLQKIRQDSRFSNLPFILTTDMPINFFGKEYLDRFKEYRLSGFISKSAPIGDVLCMIRLLVPSMEDIASREKLQFFIEQQKVRIEELKLELIQTINHKIDFLFEDDFAFQSTMMDFLRTNSMEILALQRESPENIMERALVLFRRLITDLNKRVHDIHAMEPPDLTHKRHYFKEISLLKTKMAIATTIQKVIADTTSAKGCGILFVAQ